MIQFDNNITIDPKEIKEVGFSSEDPTSNRSYILLKNNKKILLQINYRDVLKKISEYYSDRSKHIFEELKSFKENTPTKKQIKELKKKYKIENKSSKQRKEQNMILTTQKVNNHVSYKKNIKIVSFPDYNLVFNTVNGKAVRCGKNFKEDPIYSPYGPEIVDMEISTICSGPKGIPCNWCYKSNTKKGNNMSLETFKNIFHKLPKTVTQIAFGIGDIEANPDIWKIFHYCKNNSYNYVVPNVTVNGSGITEHVAKKLSDYCGAVAVSRYPGNHELCYDTVELLATKYGMKQVNIHQLLSEDTLDECEKIVDEKINNPKLNNLNAIVFLLLKPKGKRNNLTPFKNIEVLSKIIKKAIYNNIPIGFDSCSTKYFYQIIENELDPKIQESIKQTIDPCESFGFFSMYINVDGKYFPCSFCEGEKEFQEGIDLLSINDFMQELWYNERVVELRNKVIEQRKTGDVSCPVFDI